MNPNTITQRTKAFTLIELILALALSAVLLALLGSALTFGISRAVGSRERVEQIRLVEGVVSLVREDIHRAVIYNPQDTADAMELAEASAEFDVDSIDDIDSLGGADNGGGQSDTGSTSGEELSLRRPLGLYGTLQELEIDVLREHPHFEIDAGGGVVAPTGTSGITTVRYAFGQGMASLGVGQSLRQASLANGLVRQEANRDLLNWAKQMGSTAALLGTPQLVAPEVTGLEFRYFDGVELLETWDTELTGGQLPTAIELRLGFAKQKTDDDRATTRIQSLPYVVTIALPATWNSINTDVSTAAGDESSSGNSSSDSSNGSGGGR